MTQLFHQDLTRIIINCFYRLYNTLGYGFLEKVYENAMIIELQNSQLKASKQQNIKVYYNGNQIGDYFADIVVNDCVIIELKAAEAICEPHEHQLLNYLKATEIEIGLLLNFGNKPEFRRKIFSNSNKPVKLPK